MYDSQSVVLFPRRTLSRLYELDSGRTPQERDKMLACTQSIQSNPVDTSTRNTFTSHDPHQITVVTTSDGTHFRPEFIEGVQLQQFHCVSVEVARLLTQFSSNCRLHSIYGW